MNSPSSNHSISFIRVSTDRGRERLRVSERDRERGRGGEDVTEDSMRKSRAVQQCGGPVY